MVWAWEAFDLLSRQRQIGPGGPQPIAVSDLNAYCDLKGITTEIKVDFLLRVIPELDGVYLKKFYDDQHERMEKQRKSAEAKAKQNRR